MAESDIFAAGTQGMCQHDDGHAWVTGKPLFAEYPPVDGERDHGDVVYVSRQCRRCGFNDATPPEVVCPTCGAGSSFLMPVGEEPNAFKYGVIPTWLGCVECSTMHRYPGGFEEAAQ